jgi:hypothetical protein
MRCAQLSCGSKRPAKSSGAARRIQILAKAQNPVLGNISSDRVADDGRRAAQ